MTARYSVMVGFRSYEMQEMAQTFWHDAQALQLQKAARDRAAQTTVVFTFPFDAPNVPPIKEGMQVWIGWRDGGSWLQGPDPPWMGYIVEQAGRQRGGEHVITAQVSSMNLLFTRTDVLSWPSGPDPDLPVLDENGDPTGYPPDYSVTNWLVGTDPYPGIVRARLQNIDYSGVDPAFDNLMFPWQYIPGGTGRQYTVGWWGNVTLDEVLQDIVGMARNVAAVEGRLIEPIYFFDTVAQGSILRPRFRFIDGNDTSGPIAAVFSTRPTAGQYRMRAFEHRRVLTESRTRVVAVGVGGHYGPNGEVLPDRSIFADHVDDYPTEYTVAPGWSGKPYLDEHIEDQAAAERVATTIGYRIWGALGALSFESDGLPVGGGDRAYFQQGDIIAIDNPAEGLTADQPRVLRNVQLIAGSAGAPWWKFTLGDVVPDAATLIRGATVVQPLQHTTAPGAAGGPIGASLGPRGLPDAPRRLPVDQTPVHSQQNVLRPAYADVVGHTYKATLQVRPEQDPATVTPANLTQWTDAHGNVMDYHTPLGVSPARMPFDFSTVGTVKWTSDETGQFLRAVVTPSTCAFTLTVAGVAVSNPPVYAQLGASGDPLSLISSGDVVPYAEGDEIAITATSAGTVTLSHRATQVVPS